MRKNKSYLFVFVKNNLLLIFSFILISVSAFAQERPFIWVKKSDRAQILDKIQNQQWAKTTYTDFISQLGKDIKLHQSNPSEFLKGMPFDWEKTKPGQTPPFYLTFHIEKGIHKNLDNATKEEMANARKLIRFLGIGIDCGIAYYLTEDQKYAQCAIDILNSFVNGVSQAKLSDWHGRGGWLFPDDGFREVREIGYKIPLIYDFTASFIKKGGKPFDLGKNEKTDFPLAETQQVFRTYADISVNYGGTNSNHPILEAPSLVYNSLAMDDVKERNKLLSYFLTESTPNQDALNKVALLYKVEGDTWPETSQYTNGVSSILVELMFILNKYDPSLHLGLKYPNIVFALPKWLYLKYPNNEVVRFGDGKRHGGADYNSFELAYKLGKMDGVKKITDKFGTLLSTAIAEGNYSRRGISALLWFEDDFKYEIKPIVIPRTDQLSHAGLFLQRNLSPTSNPVDGLMCFVGGASMVHGHAEGMNIELYGRGQVLGVDNGRGSYQQDIHENYSRIFAAHNTVIVNGSSQGDGDWSNQGINTVQLKTIEPLPTKEAVSRDYSFTKTTFSDDKGDKAEATQERTLALVRTSETTGYYVDVFRSKSALPNEYHDYLYHNIGDELQFLNKDLTFKADPTRYQANAKGPWLQNKQYRIPGWHFFENVETSPLYSGDLQAQFNTGKLKAGPLTMRLFIPGCQQREYTKVMAPHTFEAPSPYDNLPTPTLVIRKNGEAWASPFVVVFEPFDGNKSNGSIQSVTKLEQNGIFKGLKIVSKLNEGTFTQFVLVQSDNEIFTDKNSGIVFQGEFGLITLNGKNELQNLYLGHGTKLAFKKAELSSFNDQAIGGFIDFTTTIPTIKVNGKSSVQLPDGSRIIKE
jgi:hypothetical protein